MCCSLTSDGSGSLPPPPTRWSPWRVISTLCAPGSTGSPSFERRSIPASRRGAGSCRQPTRDRRFSSSAAGPRRSTCIPSADSCRTGLRSRGSRTSKTSQPSRHAGRRRAFDAAFGPPESHRPRHSPLSSDARPVWRRPVGASGPLPRLNRMTLGSIKARGRHGENAFPHRISSARFREEMPPSGPQASTGWRRHNFHRPHDSKSRAYALRLRFWTAPYCAAAMRLRP